MGAWFSVHRIVWLEALVFLSLWHVRITWQKQSCAKIKSPELCAIVLLELGSIMYDQEGPWEVDAEKWAMLKIMDLIMK